MEFDQGGCAVGDLDHATIDDFVDTTAKPRLEEADARYLNFGVANTSWTVKSLISMLKDWSSEINVDHGDRGRFVEEALLRLVAHGMIVPAFEKTPPSTEQTWELAQKAETYLFAANQTDEQRKEVRSEALKLLHTLDWRTRPTEVVRLTTELRQLVKGFPQDSEKAAEWLALPTLADAWRFTTAQRGRPRVPETAPGVEALVADAIGLLEEVLHGAEVEPLEGATLPVPGTSFWLTKPEAERVLTAVVATLRPKYGFYDFQWRTFRTYLKELVSHATGSRTARRPFAVAATAGTGGGKTTAGYLGVVLTIAARKVAKERLKPAVEDLKSNRGKLREQPASAQAAELLSEIEGRVSDYVVGSRIRDLAGQADDPAAPSEVARLELLGLSAVAIYPRIELCRDQVNVLNTWLYKLGPLLKAPGCPDVAFVLQVRNQDSALAGTKDEGFPVPCPEENCEGLLDKTGKCRKDGGHLTPCRREIGEEPKGENADILVTTDVTLDRLLSTNRYDAYKYGFAPEINSRSLGCHPVVRYPPAAILVDEAHLYAGRQGAYTSWVLRRLLARCGQEGRGAFAALPITHPAGNEKRGTVYASLAELGARDEGTWAWHREPVVFALSATLPDAIGQISSLTGVDTQDIHVEEPAPDELDRVARHHLTLRAASSEQGAEMNLLLQTVLLLSRLRYRPNRYLDPKAVHPPWHALVFVDSRPVVLDVAKKLQNEKTGEESPDPLVTYRTAKRWSTLKPSRLGEARIRGQVWDLLAWDWPEHRKMYPQFWGDNPKSAGPWLSNMDRGVSTVMAGRGQDQDEPLDGHATISTSALEVGVDDERFGAIIQYRSPLTMDGFVQRIGRAGRRVDQDPWAILALGRDGKDGASFFRHDEYVDGTLSIEHVALTAAGVVRDQRMRAFMDCLLWMSRGNLGHLDRLVRRYHRDWMDRQSPDIDDVERAEGEIKSVVDTVLGAPTGVKPTDAAAWAQLIATYRDVWTEVENNPFDPDQKRAYNNTNIPLDFGLPSPFFEDQPRSVEQGHDWRVLVSKRLLPGGTYELSEDKSCLFDENDRYHWKDRKGAPHSGPHSNFETALKGKHVDREQGLYVSWDDTPQQVASRTEHEDQSFSAYIRPVGLVELREALTDTQQSHHGMDVAGLTVELQRKIERAWLSDLDGPVRITYEPPIESKVSGLRAIRVRVASTTDGPSSDTDDAWRQVSDPRHQARADLRTAVLIEKFAAIAYETGFDQRIAYPLVDACTYVLGMGPKRDTKEVVPDLSDAIERLGTSAQTVPESEQRKNQVLHFLKNQDRRIRLAEAVETTRGVWSEPGTWEDLVDDKDVRRVLSSTLGAMSSRTVAASIQDSSLMPVVRTQAEAEGGLEAYLCEDADLQTLAVDAIDAQHLDDAGTYPPAFAARLARGMHAQLTASTVDEVVTAALELIGEGRAGLMGEVFTPEILEETLRMSGVPFPRVAQAFLGPLCIPPSGSAELADAVLATRRRWQQLVAETGLSLTPRVLAAVLHTSDVDHLMHLLDRGHNGPPMWSTEEQRPKEVHASRLLTFIADHRALSLELDPLLNTPNEERLRTTATRTLQWWLRAQNPEQFVSIADVAGGRHVAGDYLHLRQGSREHPRRLFGLAGDFISAGYTVTVSRFSAREGHELRLETPS